MGRLGENQRVIEHLQEMYVLADDPALRAQIEAELREREAEVDNVALIELMRSIETERRELYPFVPPDFYSIVRPVRDLDQAPGRWFVE